MDSSGNIGAGLKIRNNKTLEIVGGKIKIGVEKLISIAETGKVIVGITDEDGTHEAKLPSGELKRVSPHDRQRRIRPCASY